MKEGCVELWTFISRNHNKFLEHAGRSQTAACIRQRMSSVVIDTGLRVEIQAKLCCYVLPVELGCADFSKTELRLCCSQHTGGRQLTTYQNRKQAVQLVSEVSEEKTSRVKKQGIDLILIASATPDATVLVVIGRKISDYRVPTLTNKSQFIIDRHGKRGKVVDETYRSTTAPHKMKKTCG
ncbi:hypothetical protein DAPPUDRAFT_115017 [Daphnia pulex]|uniref:Uncharacterized protein n=1 Tax=Daphnia pulex TaxID=6669 RepID=E9HJY7_DAPPU|nr:hypothetical protein DAPPUDRAFT_115017 [Daphnia pulex]|eukprot:EFX67947.1 hypothetical protein DAPPUDRAFT_115017 [Daphnia pulex]